MPKNRRNNANPDQRLVDLLERLCAIGLYLATDMGYHEIARKLGMGTQRVMAILKGISKPPSPNKSKT